MSLAAQQVGSITFGSTCNCDGACLLHGGHCPRMSADPPAFVMPGHSIIGSCSLCGGAVTVPTIWHGIVPPTPTCSSCGATKRAAHGPVIPMEKKAR